MILQGKNKTPVREVILHCAAIPTGYFLGQSPFQVWSTINRWHRERGFRNGFGYHCLVMPDGRIQSGRPCEMIGAHVIGHNAGTLGVLMIESRKIEVAEGKTVADYSFRHWFKEAQFEAVRRWIYGKPGIEKVSGHNDYAPRLCPGFKIRSDDWL